MAESETKFWMNNPCILISDPVIFPTKEMTKIEQLNALSRLVFIIAAILYFMDYDKKNTLLFILISLVIIFILYSKETNKESFTVTPTYTSPDFHQTTVAPTFAEEWQIPPPSYDLYVNRPEETSTFEAPLNPQSYPYGQYLTKTNLLPSDEYYTHLECGGTKSAREYANSTYLRNDLAFRDNMTRIFKKKLARQFRHNCNDTFSPFQSY